MLGDDGDGGSSGDDHAAAATDCRFVSSWIICQKFPFFDMTVLLYGAVFVSPPPTSSVVLLLNFRILHCL